ncbi:family 2 glycosyl transferase [Paenibacillus terrae HPL-003]|uniref:Family 2 glycosyl transferase n=1 Tax=Paenibacillus terrae (strain HPL-003) TaxID=985665 RepID=G7VUJ2_PAETH|nr:glycosyltransferase family 2 protein [Paenibacillus terrae]AET57599.1 family 2 glycosyl transferase [Paenibacillus terrae HPL-003]
MNVIENKNWEIPNFELKEFKSKSSKYCVCIPVINEGVKIQKQLNKLKSLAETVDIIILDGGSTDGSLDESFLLDNHVRAILVKKDKGKLSAQLRMGFAYALQEQYEGIITVDGNNKDSVESIPEFIQKLDEGYDFVQGSRYVPGGKEINTPISRKLAIKLIHAPFISLVAGYHYTDTTNGFRAHSARFLKDPHLHPFRDVFETYELLGYLSVKAPKFGYKVTEIPVERSYPKGKIPTKISPLRGNMLLIKILLNLYLRKYDSKNNLKVSKEEQ